MKKLYSLGLDLGIASIGWALMKINENNEVIRIEDCGVKIFRKLEDDKDGKLANFTRRTKRGQRRIRRRRQTRLRDLRKLLKHEFNIEFFNLDLSNNSPWHIRLKGLKEKLTKEELSIALYHYCKHRGFKSNRKVDDDELKKTKSEDSVLLSGIESVANILRDKDITVVEYLANKTDDFKERIYNSPDNYMNTFSRKMIEDEINKLLDTQVKFGVCNDEFKNKYLKIWSRQRDFSEGPGKGSIYGTDGQGSIIEKMVGKCSYDNEMRAPKGSFSAESFVLLSMLVNLRYKGENEGSYKSLTKEEITKLYNIALNKAKITYKDVASVIGKDKIRFKGLELSKKEYIAKVKAFGKDIQENKDEFDKYINKTLLSKELKGLKTYHQQLNIIKKAIKDDPDNSEIYERFINNKSNFDKISTILLLNKTDNKIKEALNKEGFIDKCIIDNILKMKGINETINLSIPLCQKLIPFLLEGNTYDKAMKQLGFDLENRFSHINEHKYLPKVDEMIDELKLHLTNVNVIHVLTEARKLINALIKEYGKPQIINIELSRELALPFDKRRQKNREMLDNAYENLKLRKQIFLKYPHIFKSVNSVSNDDLLRYKLFKEQGGISPYSQKPIHEKDIFNHEVCEVDSICHIREPLMIVI